MSKLFFSDKMLYRLLKNRDRLREVERRLGVKIESKGRGGITITSLRKDSVAEYNASRILEAFALGFELDIALQLEDVNYSLAKLNIKDLVRSTRVSSAIGRIIGREGRTKRVIEELSECAIVVSDHTAAVIGRSENVETATSALMSLIRGSKQANIYRFLEKSRVRLKELEEDIERYIEKKQQKETPGRKPKKDKR